ncbi:MAG: pilus assembly protein TadG-related protein [Bryobacteraceae bacterium]
MHVLQVRRTRRSRERGFTLVTMAVSLVALIAVVGLAVDIGRMYIAKNEAQSYVDSAALAATLELDGTSEGLFRARQQVAGNPNRWNLNTSTFSNTTTAFAKDRNGPWETNPTSPSGYRFARVSTTVDLPLFFLPVVTGSKVQGGAPMSFLMLSATSSVAARSGAGQEPQNTFREGLFPFSPYAHSLEPPHFGLAPGQRYTLRWPANPKKNVNVCPGDNIDAIIQLSLAGGGEERGFIEQTSASIIRASIEFDYQSVFRTVGDSVNMTGGAKQSQYTSLMNRINQDTDPLSNTYAQYVASGIGNGRRLVGALVNTGFPDYTAVNIGAFFLLRNSEYNPGGNRPFCAEYVGSWVQGSNNKGVEPSGGYVARLVQ